MFSVKKVNKRIYILLFFVFLTVLVLFNQYWGRLKLREAFDKMENIKSISFDYSLSSAESYLYKSKIWKEEEKGEIKAREDVEEMERPINSIWDFSENIVYWYSPSTNSARKTILDKPASEYSFPGSRKSFLEEIDTIQQHIPLLFSRTTLDDKQCVFLILFRHGKLEKHWIWEEYGIPIRIEAEEVVFLRDNIKTNIDIQSEIFELPSGVKINPKKEDVSSWETYINEDYGFEIKYPETDWVFNEYTPESYARTFNFCKELPEGEWQDIFCITGQILTLTPECNIDWNKETIENPPYEACGLPFRGFYLKKTAIGLEEVGYIDTTGMILVGNEARGEGVGPIIFALFPLKKQIEGSPAILSIHYLISQEETHRIFNQMFSSFRLLD
jgi:hypothetical protein